MTTNEVNASTSCEDKDMERDWQDSTELDRFVDHFLSILCDHSRRQILELLANPDDELPPDEHISPLERRSGDIARELGLSPGTVSGHLRQLANIGLVASRREGNAIYYRLSNHMLVRAFHDLLLALNEEHTQRFRKAT